MRIHCSYTLGSKKPLKLVGIAKCNMFKIIPCHWIVSKADFSSPLQFTELAKLCFEPFLKLEEVQM